MPRWHQGTGDSFMFDSFSANMMLQTNHFMLETRNIKKKIWVETQLLVWSDWMWMGFQTPLHQTHTEPHPKTIGLLKIIGYCTQNLMANLVHHQMVPIKAAIKAAITWGHTCHIARWFAMLWQRCQMLIPSTFALRGFDPKSEVAGTENG